MDGWLRGIRSRQWMGLLSGSAEILGPGYRRAEVGSEDWVAHGGSMAVEKSFGPALKRSWRVTAAAVYETSTGGTPLAVVPLEDPVTVQPGQRFRYQLEIAAL